jgi:hypothetical protein
MTCQQLIDHPLLNFFLGALTVFITLVLVELIMRKGK